MVLSTKQRKEFIKVIRRLDRNKIGKKAKSIMTSAINNNKEINEAIDKVGKECPDQLTIFKKCLGIEE
jgi:hypothetical protein